MKKLLVALLLTLGCTREKIEYVYVNVPTTVVTPSPVASGPCVFPQGLNYTTHPGLPTLGPEVNAAMSKILECPVESECKWPGYDPQSFYYSLGKELRAMGLCAGQPEEGRSDEIAVGRDATRFQIYHAWSYAGRPLWVRPRSTPCVGVEGCGNPYRGDAVPR